MQVVLFNLIELQQTNEKRTHLWLDFGCLCFSVILTGCKRHLSNTALQHLLSRCLPKNQLRLHLQTKHTHTAVHTMSGWWWNITHGA